MSKPRSTKKAKPAKPQFKLAFEEVEFVCANCGKKVSMIKTPGLSTEGMLCQKCVKGETVSDSG